jgi:(2R)-ethylmalonyl-CoA mutase
VLAYETDVLEYGRDIFEGSVVVEEKVGELMAGAQAELGRIQQIGDSAQAIDVMKRALVASHADRQRRIESGELVMVGVNKFVEHEPSPLVAADSESILVIDPDAERRQVERLRAFRAGRNRAEVAAALQALADAARGGENIMPASIRAAHAGLTTGEWAAALRTVFGEYRAPTGLQGAAFSGDGGALAAVRARAVAVSRNLGHPIRLLVAKPGLDGHSNGAEQVAVRGKEAGLEVIYDGIRLTPEQIAASAADEDVDAVGLSIHSGSHMTLIPRVTELLRQRGITDVPVVVGGIIPPADREALARAGVARVYTPGESTLTEIIGDIVDLVAERRAKAA